MKAILIAVAFAAIIVTGACKERAPTLPPDRTELRPPDVTVESDAGVDQGPDPTAALGPFRRAADIPPDTPLHRLVTEGVCYEAEGHDFVVCSADHLDGRDRDDGPIGVGRDKRLHIAKASGATSTGNSSASSFRDARFFEYERPFNHADRGDFVAGLSAPGYGRDGGTRFLACGPDLFELRQVAPGKSREILTTWEIVSEAPTVTVGVYRAEDGTMLAHVTQRGDGLPPVRELFFGKPEAMRRLDVVGRDYGATFVAYNLPGGGRVYLKGYKSRFRKGGPAVEYPDGTKFMAGLVPGAFQWSTLRLRESAPELKLYVPTDEEVAAVRRELKIPSPAATSVLAPCSAALGPPPAPDAIVNLDGTPRPFGACSADDPHVCMGVGRVGFDKSCRDGQCYFQPKESP